jgi:hypothetical protein
MPTVAAWIDQLRDAFGSDTIHEAIRAGQAGEPSFYARENGHELGMPLIANVHAWKLEGFTGRRFCKGCDGQCVGTEQRCHGKA